MQTRIDEIGANIFRLSTYVPEVAPPAGFTFNQFLLLADEPLLFHTGQRLLFPSVREAVERLMPVDRLKWISFGHFEADECGALNDWLAAAPRAQAAHGRLGCDISLNDFAIRPARPLADGETIDLGGLRVRHIDTPHVPHCWDAALLYEEVTGTLLCGDLFSQVGDGPALVDGDILGPAIAAEDLFGYSALSPHMGSTIRDLARLAPATLALMHGPSFRGDGAAALLALAEDYDRRGADRLATTRLAA